MAELVIQPYTIQDIIDLFNQKIPGDMLFEEEALPYLDAVIDDINSNLNACFPTLSDIMSQNSNGPEETIYDCIPKKYIRSVVVIGAAFKYYTTDEEGLGSATQYGYDYRNAMFFMVRDYSLSVPPQYQAVGQGFLMNHPDCGYYTPREDNITEVFYNAML